MPPTDTHPRLRILGPVEARLAHADRTVLAGLDEGVWPPRAEADAFLNRPMRARVGLDPPERRVGLSAHDFVQGGLVRRRRGHPGGQARRRAERTLPLPPAPAGLRGS